MEEIKKEWYDMSVDKYTKEVTLKARGKGISGDAERERDPDRNRNQQ